MPISQKSKSLKKSKKSKKNNRSKKTKNNIKNMRGGGSEAYIIITNRDTNAREVKPAYDYQANALEENIINDAVDGPHKYQMVKHSYRNGTINFSIGKQNTSMIDFSKLSFNEQKSLYILIRSDRTQTYISQNKEALDNIIRNNYT